MKDWIILAIYWDRHLVRDKNGKEFEILREKDYDEDWISLGHGFSKNNPTLSTWPFNPLIP